MNMIFEKQAMRTSILIINTSSKFNSRLEKLILTNNPEFKIFSKLTGIEGVQEAEKILPDVIILGSILSDSDSLNICTSLKNNEITKAIPVIYLIQPSTKKEIQKKAIDAGIDVFLVKPVEEFVLDLLIKSMLKIKSMDQTVNVPGSSTEESKFDEDKHLLIEKALRESEKRYRLLVENQNDLIVKFDSNRNMIYVNPNYCKCFGLSEEEIIGKKFYPLIHKEDLEKVKKSIDELEFPPYKSYHEERDKTVDGWRWFGWSKNAVLNEKGEIIEVVSVGRDITERKEIAQKLIENEEALKELNATKDKFFSIIAHDLRGPFNAILGFSELIYEKCEKKDFEDVCKMSGLLHSSAKHSFDLLTNLLEWSRTQRGKNVFEPTNNQLLSVLKNEIDLVSLAAKRKSITITCKCDETSVFADYNMLQTILRNLISNAVKYTVFGGEIIISVQKNKNEVEVSIVDNGIGISVEKQNKLFNIGEVESTPGTGNEKGTGLGLILCKEFVEKHGGKIWVESIEGKGSAFRFTLPVK